MIGCTTILTTLTPDYEVGELHIGHRMLSQYGLFGWQPTVLRGQKVKHGTQWSVTHPGGGSTLDLFPGEYAVHLDTTYTLLVYLQGDYLPARIYETLVALVGMEKRDVYLLKSAAFTLNQTPIIQTIYPLCEMTDNGFTYLAFEEVDTDMVQVHTYVEPEWIQGDEPEDLVVEDMREVESPNYSALGEDEPYYSSPDEEEE